MAKKILIVDDDLSVLEMLTSYFGENGYDIETASTSVDGLRKAGEVAADLVLLDKALADGDGFDVLENLKESDPNLPVIILTGMGHDDDLREEAMNHGATAYLSKNLPIEELQMEVRRYLNDDLEAVFAVHGGKLL